MKAYREHREDIDNAVKVLRNGGLILYPTDTVWGIGCDATNEDAVGKVNKLKNQSDKRSMLVLIDSDNRLSRYIKEIPEIAWDLIDAADKPLTIIYPGAKNLAKNLIPIDGTIGIRITKDDFSSTLISKFGKPIVSTSANAAGKKAPSNFSGISEEIIEGVDYVVNYRQDDYQKNQPSGIIRIGLKGEVEILRH